jgi:hypothetical protein
LAAVFFSVAISISTRKFLAITTTADKKQDTDNTFEIIESLSDPILLMEIKEGTK